MAIDFLDLARRRVETKATLDQIDNEIRTYLDGVSGPPARPQRPVGTRWGERRAEASGGPAGGPGGRGGDARIHSAASWPPAIGDW
jgi:hypothetical protein